MSVITGFTGPLEDRIAIRELTDSYADTAFRSDREGWLACWTDDCVWVTPFGEVRGKAGLTEQWGQIGTMFGVIGFFPLLAAVAIDGDRATARSYVREIAARTEQYWCPVKHSRTIPSPHSRYHLFVDYGDGSGYRHHLPSLRRALRPPPAETTAAAAGDSRTGRPTQHDG